MHVTFMGCGPSYVLPATGSAATVAAPGGRRRLLTALASATVRAAIT
ncbi:hypothetical protein [Streptomyces bungoensis]